MYDEVRFSEEYKLPQVYQTKSLDEPCMDQYIISRDIITKNGAKYLLPAIIHAYCFELDELGNYVLDSKNNHVSLNVTLVANKGYLLFLDRKCNGHCSILEKIACPACRKKGGVYYNGTEVNCGLCYSELKLEAR